ncbi:viroplasmin family protein [Clostridium saudiense]|uniref:ribonuclease H1 domain-containing protein n=1 Tax=Clostridium saudiense TaxID=1414720 RepID=UPI0018A8BC1D|nr:ribonuclease H family protein [Clostridium saudiense]
MGKFYAVKNGRNIGIYNSWNECKKQIDGFKGAIYKSFLSEKEAEEFIGNKKNENISILHCNDDEKVNESEGAIAYVDGSYSDSYNFYSYGVVIIHKNNIIRFSGKDNREDDLPMRNVAGELLGAIEAIKWALNNNINDIYLHYDYEGIEKWANGLWKANKSGPKMYKHFIEKVKNLINIHFIKVKAHSGIKYNEEADLLAKGEFNNLDNSLLNKNDIYLEKFYSIMKKQGKGKNKCFITFKDINITESKLKKFAKEIWKLNSREENEIDTMQIELIIEEQMVCIEINDVHNNIIKYNISLCNE